MSPDGHTRRVSTESSEGQVPEFVRDPLAYAEETRRLAEELEHHVFPPWRWAGWYRRRRVIEERLRNLHVLRRTTEESEGKEG
jgi:hypothetical protein